MVGWITVCSSRSSVCKPTGGHKNWVDGNETALGNLLAEKNRLHGAYIDCPTAADEAAFYQCRRQAQQQQREMKDSWMARKAEEILIDLDHNDPGNIFVTITAIDRPPTKKLHRFSAPTDQHF
nr:unnamed protein product [Spirometra erinaceieuropaei]